jgi:hypothetical protein
MFSRYYDAGTITEIVLKKDQAIITYMIDEQPSVGVVKRENALRFIQEGRVNVGDRVVLQGEMMTHNTRFARMLVTKFIEKITVFP